MKLTPEQVEHIAALARLDLSKEDKEAFSRQLSPVLEYVGQLQRVDTEGVEPLAYGVDLRNAMRPDAVIAADAGVRDRLLAGFIDRQDDLLKTKAVFG